MSESVMVSTLSECKFSLVLLQITVTFSITIMVAEDLEAELNSCH